MSTPESPSKCDQCEKILQYYWIIYVPIILGLITIVFLSGGLTLVIYGSLHHQAMMWGWGIPLVFIGTVIGLCFLVLTCYIVITSTTPGTGLSH